MRSWWRDEQQFVREALVTAMHHSSSKVHTANGAPADQTTVTRAGEEEGHEKTQRATATEAPLLPRRSSS